MSDNIIRLFSHAIFFLPSFKMLKLEFLFIEWVVGGDKYYTVVDGDKRLQDTLGTININRSVSLHQCLVCFFPLLFFFLFVRLSTGWSTKAAGATAGE